MADRPWYTVIAATVLAIAFGGAAFWLVAFTDVDSAVYVAFLSPALLLVGFITGQAVPGPVTSMLNRAAVAPAVAEPDEPDDSPSADDIVFIARREVQRAEAERLGGAPSA